jgi:MarR family transcriptional regulator, transcriptional regulator for hemolysin
MLTRTERDGLIQRAPDSANGRSSRVSLTEAAEARLPNAVAALLQGNREALGAASRTRRPRSLLPCSRD